MKILGIIPARGGSKGVPGKNGKLLNGIPLLEYTVRSAREASRLDDIIFTSEDKGLQDLATELGIKVPFTRPSELSTDTAGSLEVVLHALGVMEEKGDSFDAVCLLQVTNPFRRPGLIDEAIDKFLQNDHDSLISVLPVPHEYNPHWVFESDESGSLKISTGEEQIIPRRQDLPKTFHRDGSIYITKTEVLREQRSFFGASLGFIETDPTTHVNIDTADDWLKAEELAKSIFG